ncbi:MAG: hypothetical protein R3F30_00765 [Planctomycetota bacterium]
MRCGSRSCSAANSTGARSGFGRYVLLHHSRFGWIEGLHLPEGSWLTSAAVGVTCCRYVGAPPRSCS